MAGTIGILGPVAIRELAPLLEGGAEPAALPVGLVGTPVNLLVCELHSRGWDVRVFTLAREVEDEVVLRGPRLTLNIGPYRARKRARDFFAAERAHLRRAVERDPPALLHAHWTYEFALAALATGIPTVVTAHDAPLAVLRLDPSPYRFIRTLMAYRAYQRSRSVIAVSPYTADHIRRFMLYRGHLAVIPNGISVDTFDLRKERTRNGPGVVFATVLQGWSRRKNGAAAISAFARVRTKLPEARLIMFGADHGHDQRAEQWAQHNGVAEGIDFAGFVPRPQMLQRLGAEVDVLVHPAREESHGMVLVEAMALGLAVIGGEDSGAVSWTLDFGRAGRLVDVTDPGAISEAMLDLALDEPTRRELANRGRDSARTRFGIAEVTAEHEALYAQASLRR